MSEESTTPDLVELENLDLVRSIYAAWDGYGAEADEYVR